MSTAPSSNKESPQLMLSLSQDGALQQVLRDLSGGLQVGETADFWKRWGSKTNSSALESPIAPRVRQAIALQHHDLIVSAPKELASFPWGTWLNTVVIWCDSNLPMSSDIEKYERSYRNVVSLSYDIVNSTAMMAELGAENYFLLINQLHAKFAQISLKWNGKSDLSQGDDGSMCYFGADQADEHAALSAMEAAYEMQSVASSNDWPVRIGLAQGRVAIEGGQPVGLSVHLAARIQKAAHLGAVWLTQELHSKLSHRFTFVKIQLPQELKGFDSETPLAQLVGLIATSNQASDIAKDSTQKEELFVGRGAATEEIASAWCLASQGYGQDCLVHGVAGIGKSALLRHALRQINARRIIHLRASPHDGRVVFGTLRSWISLELGLSQRTSKQYLSEELSRCLLTKPDWHKFESALQDLLELPSNESLFEEPKARHESTMLAILQWVKFEAKKSPIVIWVDDYQWADASTQEWIALLKAHLSDEFGLLLIICERTNDLSVPNYLKPLHSIELKPLNASESRDLIGLVAPKLASNSHWVGVLQARAKGIPLFLRETAILFESAEQQKKIEQAQKLGQPLDVPTSLQDLLLQRLEQLGEFKKLAQTASIFGQEFIWDEVLELHSSTTAQAWSAPKNVLQKLLDTGIWVDQTHQIPFSLANNNLAFSHAALRDVAYQSMWESDRRKLHAAAAQLLANKQNQDPLQVTRLARHWAAAGETMLAIDQLFSEGKASKRRGAHSIAVQCMEATLQLLYTEAPTLETIRKRIDAHLALAGQIMVTQGYSASAVHEHSLQAIDLARKLDEPKALLRSQMSLQSIYFMRGDFADAHRLLDESMAVAEQVNHPLTTLQRQWACGNLAFYEGDFIHAERIMADCVQWCIQHSLGGELIQNPKIMAQMYRSYSLWCLGRAGDAIETAALGCKWAEAGSNRLTKVQAHGIAAMVFYGCGLWQETLDSAEQAFASCEEGEYAMWLAHAGFMRGAALAQRGEFQNGVEQMRLHHAQWASSGGVLTRSYYWALEAEILKNNHDLHAARLCITQAKEIMMKMPERYYVSEVRRVSACLQWDGTNDSATKLAAYDQLLEAYRDASSRQAWGLAFRVATSMLECCGKEASLISINRQQHAEANLLECVQHLQPSTLQRIEHESLLTQITSQVFAIANFRKKAT